MDRFLYAGLRAASGLGYRLGRRLTPAGRWTLAGLIASAVWGVDTNLSMAYQAFTLLLALLALAAARGLRLGAKVEVRRELPRFGTAGEPLRYRLAVRNLAAAALRGVTLFDDLADPRPAYEEFHRDPDPAGERLHWLEGWLGVSRWRRLIGRQAARGEGLELPDLPPGDSAEVEARLVCAGRGRVQLEAVTLGRADPLGLVRALRREALPQSVLVLPRRYPVGRIHMPGARRYQHGGVALSSSVGDSQEFIGLRDYRPGDPLRRIHWRSWAKVGAPVVREHQDEFFVRHALALDTFGPGGPAFEEAVSVAASFACSVMTQESLLDLLFVGAQAYCFTAGRGLGGADRMLEVLAGVAPRAGRGFDELRAAVLRRRDALSGCICVLLGLDEERRRFVRELAGLAVPALALVIAPPGEVPDPPAGVRVLEPGKVAEGLAAL